MDVVGYTDRPSVKAGETVKFMVSSREATYRADIVRLIHGDPNPTGPGLREEVFEASVNGEYAGREQVITKGSLRRCSRQSPDTQSKVGVHSGLDMAHHPRQRVAGHRDQVVGGRVTGVRALH